MKLALLSVISEEDGIKRFVQKMCPPLGFFYIESYLKRNLPGTEVLISTDVHQILKWKPDVIGVSSVSENFCIAVKLMKLIKKKTRIPIILGGVHISSLPAQLPLTCELGVIGEGEDAILDLLSIYAEYGKFEVSKLSAVPGIVYRIQDGDVRITTGRPLINPLDKIPFPERHFIDPLGITHVISSRGCPYKCIFCSTSEFWKCFRAHSAEYVASELKSIMEKISPPHIKFFDDLFIASKERIKKLSAIILKEKLIPEFGFSCFARAELLDREMIEMLKKIGFTGVAIGIESGSQEILRRLKGNSSVETNQKALDLCKEYGINTTCSFVLGMPGETEKDLQMTYDFIISNEDKIAEIEICPIVPFPGTELWDYAEKRGLVSIDMDWGLLEDYSIFTQYIPERYIYLNEDMSIDKFNEYCIKFIDIYRHFCQKANRLYGDVFEKMRRR